MIRRHSIGRRGKIAGLGLMALLTCNVSFSQQSAIGKPDSYDWNNRAPDQRFKADILLVVAHPDDEVMAGAYLARKIFDHHKRVAVVFQNPGDGGVNESGPEQGV